MQPSLLTLVQFTWTGSQRVNGEWMDEMRNCREQCTAEKPAESERRACVDSTCYARAAEAYKGPKLSVPRLLHSVYGEYPLKLIVLLRDPVERLHTGEPSR